MLKVGKAPAPTLITLLVISILGFILNVQYGKKNVNCYISLLGMLYVCLTMLSTIHNQIMGNFDKGLK